MSTILKGAGLIAALALSTTAAACSCIAVSFALAGLYAVGIWAARQCLAGRPKREALAWLATTTPAFALAFTIWSESTGGAIIGGLVLATIATTIART